LFAQARECAGTGETSVIGGTVGEVLDAAVESYGARLGAIIGISAIWLNGEPASRDMPVGDSDEVAVLPPVSGG
jgi:molybdopterin converting factor small subunit